jgi:hypothetical protein
MIKLRFSKSINIKIEKPMDDYQKLIVGSLDSIGFKDISVDNEFIEFKSDIKDQNLESCQRRYGDGKLSFTRQDNYLIITAITDTRKNFRISLTLSFILIIALVYFGLATDRKISDILLFGGALIISFLLEYFINSGLIKNQQNELLNIIVKEIETASHLQ